MRKGKRVSRVNFKPDPRLVKTALVFAFSLLLVVFLGKAVYEFLWQSDIFRVRGSGIKSNVVLDRNVKKEISGKSLFALNATKVRRLLLEGNPLYQEVCVLREFPATIKILVKKRLPYAQIKNNLFYLVDREGVVLSAGNPEAFGNFVEIDLYDRPRKLKPGDNINDKRLEYAFALCETLKNKETIKRFPVVSINAISLPALSFIIGGRGTKGNGNLVKVAIGIEDFERKLVILDNLVNERLKGNLAKVKYIDLRFKEGYVGTK